MIEIHEISYAYEGQKIRALDGVNACFQPGKIYSVIGPNGAGKSTLLRTLNGLIPHFYRGEFEGRVVVDGVDTRDATVAELSRTVGLVFQNPEHQLFSETVWDEVTFGPKNLNLSEERVQSLANWALDVTALSQYREVAPWTLSGGEKKKLSIAAVLATNAKYIVLDEPTLGQDAWFRDALISLLAKLSKDQGRGAVVVTHDVDWIVDLNADQITLMSQGRILAVGEPRKLLTDMDLLAGAKIVPPVVARASRALGAGNAMTPSELAEVIARRIRR